MTLMIGTTMTNVLFTPTHPFINLAISKLEIEIKDLVIRIGMLERFYRITFGLKDRWVTYRMYSIDLTATKDKKLKLQTLYTTFVNAQRHNVDILLSSEDYAMLLDIVDQNKDNKW